MGEESIDRKGIVLAGGSGTRLYPLTLPFSKQLLPVFDKPMIYYPIATLMLSGIREILLITTPNDSELFQRVLGDGSQWGLNFYYTEQHEPNGLAEAMIIGEDFLDNKPSCLVLGDNIFYGMGLGKSLHRVGGRGKGATVFGYRVRDPERYGVVEFDKNKKVIAIEEKPEHPKSPYAVTGLYFYDENASAMAKTLEPSCRGELEITDLNMLYHEQGHLHVELLGRGVAWLDTGTPASLAQASNFIEAVEFRQGMKISCPEEIAYENGWIDNQQIEKLADKCGKSAYGEYLKSIIGVREKA